MEHFYEISLTRSSKEFMKEVENLKYNDKLDLVILMTAKMREKHITTVFR